MAGAKQKKGRSLKRKRSEGSGDEEPKYDAKLSMHQNWVKMKVRKSDHVETPKELKDLIYRHWGVKMDVCPLHSEVDNLAPEAEWDEVNYCNPPYSNIRPWLERAIKEMKECGKTTIFLIPAKIHTKYWQELIFPHAAEVSLLLKRITFEGYSHSLESLMALVQIGPYSHGTSRGFGALGPYTTLSI